MTDKQKEAIKFLYNLRATIDESIMLFDEDINVKCGKETIKQITTVLNLVQTQQAKIEKYKKDYIDISKRANEYKKAIECKKCDCSVCEAHLNNIELQSELEKKDKIIDLTIAFIAKHYKEDEDIEKFAKEVMERGEWTNLSKILREYFERKLEENN